LEAKQTLHAYKNSLVYKYKEFLTASVPHKDIIRANTVGTISRHTPIERKLLDFTNTAAMKQTTLSLFPFLALLSLSLFPFYAEAQNERKKPEPKTFQEEFSRVSIQFFKSYPQSLKDRENKFIKAMNLKDSKEVKNYRREDITIGGYKGVKLIWTSLKIVEELEEIVVLELQQKPLPVFVQFQLYDTDVKTQDANIAPFIESISIDAQKLEL